MNNSNKYDLIVYGAAVAGIIYALKKRAEGGNVLLINRYGFPGGSITAGLNCLQKLKEPEQNGIYRQFISSLKKYKHGILYNDEKRAVLNPEAVKIILQDLLTAYGVDILFHVTPLVSSFKDEHCLELDLIGKDGILKVSASSLLDASENYLLSMTGGRFQASPGEKRVNLFTSEPSGNGFLAYDGISEYVMLEDGRYWISLKSREDKTEKTSASFAPVLYNSGARIQLMPPEAYAWIEPMGTEESTESRVKTIEKILSKNFLPDEQLVKAEEIEIHLCG